MSNVMIVTDSTAYIPQELVDALPIRIVPQTLVWDQETFQDGIDILPEAFYERLKTARVMPTTAQVSPKTFFNTFQELLDQGYQVLAVLVAEPLSGTLASAWQAQAMLPGRPLEILDSRTTAMAMGFEVLIAARAAAQGADLLTCRRLVESLHSKVGVLFAVDTLEFLHRGGRIGGAARLLGTALNLKPILEIQNGRVEAVERVRTRKKSLSRLVELVMERVDGRQPVHLATLHANAAPEAREVLDILSHRLGSVEAIFSQVSPVVGVHAGPGTVGIAYLAGL